MNAEVQTPKLCPRCNVVRSSFPLTTRRFSRYGVKIYRKKYCMDCQSHQQRIAAQLRKLHAPPPPGSPCECCERPCESLMLDHDHSTHAFRGWVCRSCNSALGLLGDDAEGVGRAWMYLNS